MRGSIISPSKRRAITPRLASTNARNLNRLVAPHDLVVATPKVIYELLRVGDRSAQSGGDIAR